MYIVKRLIFLGMALSFFLQDALSVPWSTLHRRMSKLYFAMRGLISFAVFFCVNEICEKRKKGFKSVLVV
jgi:hypothetical protein